MRFKVNNKYVVDAKSHDDAIRVIKMLDAMETYSIRWIDTYAKSQGYGPDFWRYDTEIKANNVKEALEKLAKQVALGGTGTANCLVMYVSNSHATYQFSGRLSELLKKTKEQLGDSINDDWSKGISVTVTVNTDSLLAAAKAGKVQIGSGTVNPEKLMNEKSLRFRISNSYYNFGRLSWLNLTRNTSQIVFNLYDSNFTYEEFGGKKAFNKAKLTTEMNQFKNGIVADVKAAGIKVVQSKLELGGLDKFESTWRQAQVYNDSVKDRTVMGFGKFPYEYWLKNNDGKWFLAAFSKKKYTQSEIEALRKKNKLKNGKLPDYQEKIDDSVNDAEPEADVDLNFLIKDELEAIDGYRKMIAKTSNPQLLSVLSHILDEETEHVEELRAAQAGVYEVEED